MGYMKLWVEGKLWIWDEIEDELKERKEQEEAGEGKQ